MANAIKRKLVPNNYRPPHCSERGIAFFAQPSPAWNGAVYSPWVAQVKRGSLHPTALNFTWMEDVVY